MTDHTTRQSPEVNVEPGYCQCGCGQLAPIATYNMPKRGYLKGQPVRFVHGHNRAKLSPNASHKTCAKCNRLVPLTNFSKQKTTRDGAMARCKDCEGEESRAYRLRNREKLSAKGRERRTDPVYAENRARKRKQWLEQNQAHVHAYGRSQQAKARDAVRYAVQCEDFPPASTQVCEHCQEAQARHYHHHKGYSQEFKLDVVALCTECHGKAHWVMQ